MKAEPGYLIWKISIEAFAWALRLNPEWPSRWPEVRDRDRSISRRFFLAEPVAQRSVITTASGVSSSWPGPEVSVSDASS